jgi:hypothetical protein
MPKFEQSQNKLEKDPVERLDDNWKLHEKEIREHFAKKEATIDDLLKSSIHLIRTKKLVFSMNLKNQNMITTQRWL